MSRPFPDYDSEWSFLRLEIAEQYHWTLEYIDELPYMTVQDILAVRIGKNRAKQKQGKGRKL